ncbi:hypothetical protein APED_02970 [Acanthopleuribacter pedis]
MYSLNRYRCDDQNESGSSNKPWFGQEKAVRRDDKKGLAPARIAYQGFCREAEILVSNAGWGPAVVGKKPRLRLIGTGQRRLN